jgi:hypothetical protein
MTNISDIKEEISKREIRIRYLKNENNFFRAILPSKDGKKRGDVDGIISDALYTGVENVLTDIISAPAETYGFDDYFPNIADWLTRQLLDYSETKLENNLTDIEKLEEYNT